MSASIENNYTVYIGTKNDLTNSFELNHNGQDIFRRIFDGSDPNIVSIGNSTIYIPNHFFVSGEEVEYEHQNNDFHSPIQIKPTLITGIGITDRLPKKLFVHKISDILISFCADAESSLKSTPEIIEFYDVGIGNSHSINSKNQNNRVLLAVDNIIQSPIIETENKTFLKNEANFLSNVLFLNDTKFLFADDLIKINDEVMKVESVGFGSLNVIFVRRSYLKTSLQFHEVNDVVIKLSGSFNIVKNEVSFSSPPKGQIPLTRIDPVTGLYSDYTGISTRSTFNGRAFIRSGIPNGSDETYKRNYIFDDISSEFTGIKSEFLLKNRGEDVSNIFDDNAIILIKNISQFPNRDNIVKNYDFKQANEQTSIIFTKLNTSSTYDINSSNVPVGGVILSVGSTNGFGYQPIVSAGATCLISSNGNISSIIINDGGSGYRPGIQTSINVSVKLPNYPLQIVGSALVSNGSVSDVTITDPGFGYTYTNPPTVFIDPPVGYYNIPLLYSSESSIGIGSGAAVDITVSQNGKVIDFNFVNYGYGYKEGEILTLPTSNINPIVGLTTDSNFDEFKIIIDQIYTDDFSAWTLGQLEILDNLDSLFNGRRKVFPLTVKKIPKSIKAKPGSNIDVQSTLLIFINDVLQKPGESYIFKGGSIITFLEAPKSGYKSEILFYRGTKDIDVVDVDILETIQIGDKVKINDDSRFYSEDQRSVEFIKSVDSILTNTYPGPGLSLNPTLLRPIYWSKSNEDRFIDNKLAPKSRISYESSIHPTTNLIRSVGIGTTAEIFVENFRTIFDSKKENATEKNLSTIEIISNETLVSASATAIVSNDGSIESIDLIDGGSGYTYAPSVTIQNPVGTSTTQKSTAYSLISNSGFVTSIVLDYPGIGYSISNPPIVLIESPTRKIETISTVEYEGDFGFITGITTFVTGIASTAIGFELTIPNDSTLRDIDLVSIPIDSTGIKTGYYFAVKNSNVGNGLTSLTRTGEVLSIGKSFIDNIYEVISMEPIPEIIYLPLTIFIDSTLSNPLTIESGATLTIQDNANVTIDGNSPIRVIVSVQDYNGLIESLTSSEIAHFGEYSWGRIYTDKRTDPLEFTLPTDKIFSADNRSTVRRLNPLKYSDYLS